MLDVTLFSRSAYDRLIAPALEKRGQDSISPQALFGRMRMPAYKQGCFVNARIDTDSTACGSDSADFSGFDCFASAVVEFVAVSPPWLRLRKCDGDVRRLSAFGAAVLAAVTSRIVVEPAIAVPSGPGEKVVLEARVEIDGVSIRAVAGSVDSTAGGVTNLPPHRRQG
ncbi:MAG: hypothetical protein P8103_05470 [Candidatus Thiodiazotropha sp.]|jgi:hypothetical protein